jgi:rhodanese-related sulfurtransferase
MTRRALHPSRRALLSGFALVAPGAALGQGGLPSVSVREAHQRLASGRSILVDIRTPEEWAATGVATGAVRLDMTAPDFLPRLDALRRSNPDKDLDLICHSAGRTADVQQALAKQGWTRLVNVRGGMAGRWFEMGWIGAGLPVEKR